MHELRNQPLSIDLVPQYGVNNDCVLCMVKTKKANKNTPSEGTLSGFITIPLYYNNVQISHANLKLKKWNRRVRVWVG